MERTRTMLMTDSSISLCAANTLEMPWFSILWQMVMCSPTSHCQATTLQHEHSGHPPRDLSRGGIIFSSVRLAHDTTAAIRTIGMLAWDTPPLKAKKRGKSQTFRKNVHQLNINIVHRHRGSRHTISMHWCLGRDSGIHMDKLAECCTLRTHAFEHCPRCCAIKAPLL